MSQPPPAPAGSPLTAREKRAVQLAEEMVEFARPRMWTSQIPGLAELLVMFAERELTLARAAEARERRT